MEFTYADGENKSAPIVVVSDDGSTSTPDVRFIVNAGSATQSGAVSRSTAQPRPNGPYVVEKTGAGSLKIDADINIGGVPATPGYFYARGGTVDFAGGGDLYYLLAENADLVVSNGTLNSDAAYIGNFGAGSLTLRGTGIFSNFFTVNLAVNANSSGTLNYGSASGQAPTTPGTLVAGQVLGQAGNATVVFNHTSGNYSTSTSFSSIDSMRHEAGVTTINSNVAATDLKITGGSFSGTQTISGNTLTVSAGATVRASNLDYATTNIAGTVGGGTETMVGQLGISNFTFQPETTLQIRASALDYYTNGEATNDSVITYGSVDFGGTLSMVLADGFRPEVGDKIHIIDFNDPVDMTNNNFDSVVFNVPGYTGMVVPETIYYDLGSFVIELYTAQLVITAVPEPSSIALIALASMGLLRRTRRDRRHY